ncbi:MAG: S8 family serine peptidase [Candidatus Taylorbacteria bacterium]
MKNLIASITVATILFAVGLKAREQVNGETFLNSRTNTNPTRLILTEKNKSARDVALALSNVRVVYKLSSGSLIVEKPSSSAVRASLEEAYIVEEDALEDPSVFLRVSPNDPLFHYNVNLPPVPWEGSPGIFGRKTYAWYATNTGISIELYESGLMISSVPATTNASIGLEEAWDIQASGEGVIVAIVDTGIKYDHPDLGGVVWDGQPLDSNIFDTAGHGTQMAGVIAAVINNNIGTVGICPGCKLVACKIRNFLLSEILIGMSKAVESPGRIINCSWGVAQNSTALLGLCKQAEALGKIIVAAPLNSNIDYNGVLDDYPIKWGQSPTNPDGLRNLAVPVPTMPDDRALAGASASGNLFIDYGAPGYAIATTGFTATFPYIYANGSSLAVGIVSGSLALIMAHYPEEPSALALKRLGYTVDTPTAELQAKTKYGGRINLLHALQLAWPKVSIALSDPSTLSIVLSDLFTNRTQTLLVSTDLVTWSTQISSFTATNSTMTFTEPLTDSKFFRLSF